MPNIAAGVEVLIELATYTTLEHSPEWTGSHQLSVSPVHAPCLPLREAIWHHRKPAHTTSVAAGALVCRLFTEESHMATNLALDQELLDRAFRVSGEPTKKAAVTRALQEFIARREQRRVAELFGQLEWDTSFDYKAERARKQ
jgi:Arc/MetJ family transcription regulator